MSRIELGERRLDVVEFFLVCEACGADAEEVARESRRIERAKRRKR